MASTKRQQLTPDERKQLAWADQQMEAYGQLGASGPSTVALGEEYRTPLSPDNESQFQKWVREQRVPYRDEANADYDMRGFWLGQKTNDSRATQAMNAGDGRMHFPDTWKTPTHRTFSNESIYATPDAPHWEGYRLVATDGRTIADEDPSPSLLRRRR